jgi:hypothetical protein
MRSAATARKPRAKPERQTFYATMLVTRAETWCVEAESMAEARTLLAAGEGHRADAGACVHVELAVMLEEAD